VCLGITRKKLGKIQRQWGHEMKQFKNIMGYEHEPENNLSQALRSQVTKINRNLEKADKFAQNILDFNEHQQHVRQILQERDEKKRELKSRMEQERMEATKKKREAFQTKMDEIKQQKREFNKKLREGAAKIEQKFQQHQTRLIIRNESKMTRSQSESFFQKCQRAHERKENEYEELYENTKREEERAKGYLEELKQERVLRKTESARNFRDNLMKAQQKRETLLEEQTSKYINKICNKSEKIENMKNFMQSTMTKKWLENSEKGKKHQENYKEVLKLKNKWIKGVIQSHRASQDQINLHEEEKKKRVLFKREINNLKMSDNSENFAKIKRLQEARHDQILEKQRAYSLKRSLLKEQNDVLANAKIEVERKVRFKIDEMMTATIKKVRLKSAAPPPKPVVAQSEELLYN